MVFSSIQAFLDSSNWQQTPPSSSSSSNHHRHQSGGGAHILSPRPSTHGGGGGGGSTRPGSMVDRARMMNVEIPEAALKCPRCDSNNTKFCYFNNYSLTQPRHFCKNCRRYWTRGGSLRNVPVGGGYRRNRRSKSNGGGSNGGSSNAPASSSSGGPNSTIGALISSGEGHHESFLGQILPPVRLMSHYSLNNLTATNAADTVGSMNYGANTQDLSSTQLMGSSFTSIGYGGGGGASLMSCTEQWRALEPALPALGGGNLENSSNSYSGFNADESACVRQPKISSSIATQLASVKVDDNIPYRWGSNGTFPPWMDLSSFGYISG